MIDDNAAAELVDAVTARLAAKRAAAADRQAAKLAERAELARRRTYGLTRRHARKLARERPRRLQRSRKAGWRKPAGAVIVDRTSRWGNPFPVEDYGREEAIRLFEECLLDGRLISRTGRLITPAYVRQQLAGKDLVCYCDPGELCHADVLLAVANESRDPWSSAP